MSVSLIGTFDETSDAELEMRVREELGQWFGPEVVGTWEHSTYRIPFAQLNQNPPTDLLKDPRVSEGVYVCGDQGILGRSMSLWFLGGALCKLSFQIEKSSRLVSDYAETSAFKRPNF